MGGMHMGPMCGDRGLVACQAVFVLSLFFFYLLSVLQNLLFFFFCFLPSGQRAWPCRLSSQLRDQRGTILSAKNFNNQRIKRNQERTRESENMGKKEQRKLIGGQTSRKLSNNLRIDYKLNVETKRKKKNISPARFSFSLSYASFCFVSLKLG